MNRVPPRPATVVMCARGQEWRARALLLGLEEEGVRAEVVELGGEDDAVTLATDAAGRAAFDVGVGITQDGEVSIRHLALPPGHLVGAGPEADIARLREIGHDVGRIVRRFPLRHQDSSTTWPYPIRVRH